MERQSTHVTIPKKIKMDNFSPDSLSISYVRLLTAVQLLGTLPGVNTSHAKTEQSFLILSLSFFFFFNYSELLIFFFILAVLGLIAACGPSPVAASGGYSLAVGCRLLVIVRQRL